MKWKLYYVSVCLALQLMKETDIHILYSREQNVLESQIPDSLTQGEFYWLKSSNAMHATITSNPLSSKSDQH